MVRARDYHRALRKYWRRRELVGNAFREHILVQPLFWFTDESVSRTGDSIDYSILWNECRMLGAEFAVPAPWNKQARFGKTPTLAEAYELIFGKRRGRKLFAVHTERLAKAHVLSRSLER